ncbi:hypothetical protein GYMLUDRAFT_78505 [Collybiopsis luxurians FD-317 M1]|uniref:DUF6532 domain-containing protein n=1 Tax=Collybiopsis luxurians FD-317 M1 TaxID=944289 RepID=A0A0D0B8G3_9AGAR|nr:hypothetical protein GYMLUDRAFT_78505 [Collybiopsis luxurians FD-317 M1]
MQMNEPYRHPAIVAVLHQYFFSGDESLGHCFLDTFLSTNELDNAKEIPQAVLGLVSVAIYAALQEWKDGQTECQHDNFVSADFRDEYELHMKLIDKKILKPDGSGKGKYHTLMAWLYHETQLSTGVDDGLPDLDFDGMEG